MQKVEAGLSCWGWGFLWTLTGGFGGAPISSVVPERCL